jgi:CubicO group peptidase (beta-lactamase class C family)
LAELRGIGEDVRMSSAVAALRAVETLLRELEAADMFSGVVGVEQGDEELLHEAYGYASRTWGIPTTVETRFDTASITKLFTAVATLQLIERGAFTLDTSTIEYLGLEETGISPAVTPYHLLTHTSGIGDDADEEGGRTLGGPLSRAAQLRGPSNRWTRWRCTCHRRRPLALPRGRGGWPSPRSRLDCGSPLTQSEGTVHAVQEVT